VEGTGCAPLAAPLRRAEQHQDGNKYIKAWSEVHCLSFYLGC